MFPKPDGIWSSIDWKAEEEERELLKDHYYDNGCGWVYFFRNDLDQIEFVSMYDDCDASPLSPNITVVGKFKYHILDKGLVKNQSMMKELRDIKSMEDVIFGSWTIA